MGELKRRRRHASDIAITSGFLLLLLGVACNPNSDAVRVLETVPHSGTVASCRAPVYDDPQAIIWLKSWQPCSHKLSTARAKSGATAKLNQRTAAAQVVVPDATGSSVDSATQAANSGSGDFTFADVSTAKGIDGKAARQQNQRFPSTATGLGRCRCPQPSAARVLSRMVGQRLRQGMTDCAQRRLQTCVSFYIEPQTLGWPTYSVTVSTGLSSNAIQFTIE
jgi:hypothetical protein